MLGESWLNEELGSERSPNPLREGETATIVSVVNGFVRNDMGLSREDVSKYADQALLNEAHDILRARTYADEVAFSWMGEIDRAQAIGDPAREKHARESFETLTSRMGEEYNTGRTALAEAVRLAQTSGKVLLSQDTCRAVVSMDHDGYMSEAMGVDVAAMFGDNPAYDPGAVRKAQEQALAPAPVDLGRAPGRVSRPGQPGEQRQQSRRPLPSLTREPQHAPNPSREPVRASQAVNELVERLREGQTPSRDDTGPELG